MPFSDHVFVEESDWDLAEYFSGLPGTPHSSAHANLRPIPPNTPEWPPHPVSITLKNTGKGSIHYRYTQDKYNESGSGTVMAGQLLPEPIEFILFTPYNFQLRTRRDSIPNL
jgi:hypothetical protein